MLRRINWWVLICVMLGGGAALASRGWGGGGGSAIGYLDSLYVKLTGTQIASAVMTWTGAARFDSTIDARSTFSNGGSAQCGGNASSAGMMCFADPTFANGDFGTLSTFYAQNTNASGASVMAALKNDSTSTGFQFGFNTGLAALGPTGHGFARAIGTGIDVVFLDTEATGSEVFRYDQSGLANDNTSVGGGGVPINDEMIFTSKTAVLPACSSTTEGMFRYRWKTTVGSAMCLCGRDAAGSGYAYTVEHVTGTFAVSDCTS